MYYTTRSFLVKSHLGFRYMGDAYRQSSFRVGQEREQAHYVLIDSARWTVILIYTHILSPLFLKKEIPVAKYVNGECNGVLTDTITTLNKIKLFAKTNLFKQYILWISRLCKYLQKWNHSVRNRVWKQLAVT